MRILVTGAAGFIGYHVTEALARRGEEVLGVDCFTPYYSRVLKEKRVARLRQCSTFRFQDVDIADHQAFKNLVLAFGPRKIIHLAAQAGVRYSIEAPFAYEHANLKGHLSVLEVARAIDNLEHLVYASSSSVYGRNTKVPFCETDRVEHPASLYAATKRSAELMSDAYHHLYQIPQTGLRFFSVYGPWGRPDMAYWLFTEAVLRNKPVRLFSSGSLKRDWTYIEDIVKGVIAALDRPTSHQPKIYNLGNHRPETTSHLLEVIEQSVGRRAIVNDVPAPPSELEATYADVSLAMRELNYSPSTNLETGIPLFVEWFRSYSEL